MNLIRFVFRLLLGQRLPLTRGTLSVAGPAAPIRIHRDRWGIPMIEADSLPDAHFGLGFCHGQDRGWQLELLKRVSNGTISELVGPAGLMVDRLARRIGFRRASREQWPLLGQELREQLAAYSMGVNSGRMDGCPRVPHEYSLLRAFPSFWEPMDSLCIAKLLSFTLCSNWDAELARLRILEHDGPDALAALDPTYPAWHPITIPPGQPAGESGDRLARDLADFFQISPLGGASNNWAVAGSRTASGRPLLANDPHLDASIPNHWYLASVRTPGLALAGGTLVGGPAFLVAHNGHACWGLTAGLVDNTDLFQEEVGPDGASIKEGDAFVPCPVIEEVINVKDAEPVTEKVLITPRGPLVEPALLDVAREGTPPPAARKALSLRATWLDPLPLDGLLRMQPVNSFAEFRRILANWPGASQNMVYADVTGTIGYQMMGRIPRRKQGCGAIPLPGWDPRVGWESDPVPFEENPHLVNPECGYIATANNQPKIDAHDPFLGVDFIDGYRLGSIVRALESRRDWDVASTMRLQVDQRALAWEEMRDSVLAVPASDPSTARALALLRGWDGVVGADSPPAAVYELFLTEMMFRITQLKAPISTAYALGSGLSVITSHNFFSFRRTAHLVRLLREQPPGWFATSWAEEIAAALGAAVRRLESLRGPDESRWAWGEIRALVMHHALTRVGTLGKALARIFNLGPIPCGGDADVINQAAVFPFAPLANADNIPSVRAVFDVGAWHNSRFVLPGGQSGNPFSPHYGDLFPLWQRGEGVPVAFTAEEMKQAAVETLTLTPAEGDPTA
jgi:penicillin amidase